MDPLSITAGILAVIGAAKGVVSGINKAREFKHCPDELRDLRNRVCPVLYWTLKEPELTLSS